MIPLNIRPSDVRALISGAVAPVNFRTGAVALIVGAPVRPTNPTFTIWSMLSWPAITQVLLAGGTTQPPPAALAAARAVLKAEVSSFAPSHFAPAVRGSYQGLGPAN